MHLIDVFESIQGGDAWVIEGSQNPGLALQPGDAIGVQRENLRQHLNGDTTFELLVVRLVHFTHTASAEHSYDLVMCELFTDHGAVEFSRIDDFALRELLGFS